MKKFVSMSEPVIDPICKQYADEFMSCMDNKNEIMYLLDKVGTSYLVSDTFLGQGLALDFGDVVFLVYFDPTKHILQVFDKTRDMHLVCPFTNNELIVDVLKNNVIINIQ